MTNRQDDLRIWIREGLQNPRRNRSGLARALGKHPSTVTKILNGERLLKAHEVDLIADYLDAPPPLAGDITGVAANAERAPEVPDLSAEARGWQHDVPLFSSAQGDGFNEDDERRYEYDVIYGDGPTEFVARPPAVAKIKDLFAVRIRGDSMSPWREHGDVVYVAPHRPVQPGDHVIVEIKRNDFDPRRAVVKVLRSRNKRAVILGQYNPSLNNIEIPMEEVASIYRVLEWREIFPLG